MKKIFAAFLLAVLTSFSVNAFAGPMVWGPKKFERGKGEPLPVVEFFSIDKPKGKYDFYVKSGGSVQKPGAMFGIVNPVNQVSSAVVKLNGVEVVGPNDLNQEVLRIDKEVTLLPNNIIEVEVRGKPGSYITIDISKANLNPTVENKENDLWGNNMQDQNVLWWEGDKRASEYILYKAYSIDGPWVEWSRGYAGEPMNDVDITADAMKMDLCYKIEALDDKGRVIRVYEPICVPKWEEEESSIPLTKKIEPEGTVLSVANTGSFLSGCFNKIDSLQFPDINALTGLRFTGLSMPPGLQFASPFLFGTTTPVFAADPPPYNSMCLNDDEFIDYSSMTYQDIKKFLEDNKSFLNGEIADVDGTRFEPASIIYAVSQYYKINPQVILATLQKEHSAISKKTRLKDSLLEIIMGYNTSNPTTIFQQLNDATAQIRRDFDRLLNNKPTAGGWQVNVAKSSLDPLSVTPSNNAVAILFSYTPWVGQGWGGRKGGNALFCQLWKQYKFGKSCPPEPYEIAISGPDAPQNGSKYTASGGVEPYSWAVTKGSITKDGVVTVSGQCGSATVAVTDSCGAAGTKDVRLPSGSWSVVSVTRVCVDDGCFRYPDYPYERISGNTKERGMCSNYAGWLCGWGYAYAELRDIVYEWSCNP